MEDNLIKWQSIWQTQKSKPMQLNQIINRLNAIEQKAKTQRILSLVFFSVLVLVIIIRPAEVFEEQYYILAYAFTLLAIGVKLIPNLKGKYRSISNEAEFNNREIINKLKNKLSFNTKHLMLFLLLATVGLNFALLGLYEKGSLFNFDFNADNRVFIHLSTVLILIIGYFVNKRRMTKSHYEISTLIKDLEEMN